MNRQKVLLTILAGLFVLALGYAFWATPRQAKISNGDARQAAATAPAGGSPAAAETEEMRVRLELLTRENETTPDYKRNIFHFRLPAPKPLPPPPPPPPALPRGPSLEAEEVQRELARFTFLGFLLKDGVRTIFLSANEEIFVVKQGDRFGQNNRFRVTDLTPEKLTIQQNGDPRPIVVSLVEQAPLVEAPGYSPIQSVPIQSVPSRSVPSRRRGSLLPTPDSEEQQPVEPLQALESPDAAKPPDSIEPADTTAPPESPEAAKPEKDPFAVEFHPPQGAAPQ